jgi:hypothetical protein
MCNIHIAVIGVTEAVANIKRVYRLRLGDYHIIIMLFDDSRERLTNDGHYGAIDIICLSLLDSIIIIIIIIIVMDGTCVRVQFCGCVAL